ncbi:hypothetical protein EON65_53920 [archaeon]|nr:MAG: hypothetical protein EON65_53920 [archaeon]
MSGNDTISSTICSRQVDHIYYTIYEFHDLVLLDGTVDAKGYVTVPQQYLLPVIEQYFHGHPCIFQQDNAAVHTAHEVHEFFRAQHLQVLDWPPHSPDLNIIEHVWHYLKEAMRRLTPARSKEELWSNVDVALQNTCGIKT